MVKTQASGNFEALFRTITGKVKMGLKKRSWTLLKVSRPVAQSLNNSDDINSGDAISCHQG